MMDGKLERKDSGVLETDGRGCVVDTNGDKTRKRKQVAVERSEAGCVGLRSGCFERFKIRGGGGATDKALPIGCGMLPNAMREVAALSLWTNKDGDLSKRRWKKFLRAAVLETMSS